MKNEQGFALVITLLITALLVALAVEFADEVFVDTSARQNFTDAQQASLLACSGAEAGTQLLQYGLNSQNYSSLADLDRLTKLLTVTDEKGTLQVIVEEESGKLNLNAIVSPNGKDNDTYRQIANRLFNKLGLQPELLDAAADWIRTNVTPQTVGTPYYRTLKPPYAVKGGTLDTYEELRLVKGFDGKTMERLRPYITVYPDDPGNYSTAPININTAPKELLAALDDAMTDSLVQQIVDERKVTPFSIATDLGNRVSGMSALAQALASSYRIKQNEKGLVFRFISRAQVGETVRVVEAVTRSGQILYWREF